MVARLLNNTALPRLQHRAAHTVLPQLDAVIPSPEGPDRQPGPRRHHQRSAGEAHRADRGNDDGIDAGVKNRSPCRQGVPGGPRRGGEDQAITTHLVDHFPIDLELQGAGGRNLIAVGPQVEVVEGPVVLFIVFEIRLLQRARRSRSIFSRTAIHHRLKHHAPFNRELIVLKALPDLIAAQHTAVMGEKTQMASHIDAEDRDVMHRQVAGSPQDRAISPQHQSKVGQRLLNSQQAGKGIHPRPRHRGDHMGAEGF